jgi:hypothetical protein
MYVKKWNIKIESTTPIIYNRMKKEIEDEKKKLKKDQLAEWEEKNWMMKAEINNGNAVLPPEWIKSMLINACKQTRLIPHYATKKNETYTRYVQSMMIRPTPPIILSKKKDIIAHGGFYPGQPGRMTSGKVWKIFPKLETWTAEFQIVDPFGRMLKDELQQLFEHAGMFVGLGDQRSRNFGRFEVVSIKEAK